MSAHDRSLAASVSGIGAPASSAQPSTSAAAAKPAVRCRPIEPRDDKAVAALLALGFAGRTAAEWTAALSRIRTFAGSAAGGGVGYLLDAGDRPVGVLLAISSPDGQRRNISSWYTEPEFRRYASLLVNMAIRDRSVTYVNISSVRHTRPIIEAQGFRRYADGVVVALPLLSAGAKGVAVARDTPPDGSRYEAVEAEMAAAHRAMGCIVLWGTTDGRSRPFVFARRRIGGRLPAAQVIYCPADTDWRLFARRLGRALLRHGLLVLAVDSGGPLPGLTGRFLQGRMPKYARGPNPPRLGDLTWTEAALFGA